MPKHAHRVINLANEMSNLVKMFDKHGGGSSALQCSQVSYANSLAHLLCWQNTRV